MSETITVVGTDETLTLAGSSETLVLAREDEDRVLSLSCPEWSVSVGAPDSVTVVACSPEVIITSCQQGPPGPPGPPSTGATFVFEQNTPAILWIIPHNLGQFPSVTVVDSGGNEVDSEVQYLSEDLINLSFTVPFGGFAYLN